MKTLLAIAVFALLPAFLIAQEKMEPERPSESQTPNTVSKNSFMLEFGFRKEQENKTDYKVQHPNALLRFGLAEKMELRLQTAIESDRFPSKGENNYGLMPVELGLKAALFQSKDTSFSIGVVGHLGIPELASRSHEADKVYHRVRLLFENKLTDKIKLHYNVGTDWDEDRQEQEWVYTFTPEFDISDKWAAFIEEYAFIHKHNKPEHYINAGFSYMLSDHAKLDISGRRGISTEASKYIIETGIAFKL